jgi:hypothetical protein
VQKDKTQHFKNNLHLPNRNIHARLREKQARYYWGFTLKGGGGGTIKNYENHTDRFHREGQRSRNPPKSPSEPPVRALQPLPRAKHTVRRTFNIFFFLLFSAFAKNFENRLLASLCLSVRLPGLHNSAPTRRILIKFDI